MVPCIDINGRQLVTAQCYKKEERKRSLLADEDPWESSERSFQYYWENLETVALFKYLGRVLKMGDEYWPEVAEDLMKARKS